MALTKIRGSQIQDHSIGNAHIDPTSPIVYSNLDLSSSIVATDLSANHTVHTDVLDYKLVALWDLVQTLTVSGTSATVTSQVQAAAVTDTATNDGSAKGVLTTGTGANGAGIENYKVQIRDGITKDPINDNIGGSVYGELTYGGSAYTLSFKKSDASSFTMGAQEQSEITVDVNTNNVLHGKWFLITSPTAGYRIVLNYTGDSALTALAGYTDVNATIVNNDDGAAVATAIRGALNGISGGAVFTAAGSGSTVTVATVAGVVLHGLTDGSGLNETDFIFSTSAKGTPSSIDFMFEEIYSLNSAPLKGFVTGTGFTDVVTITGTHNHNDLYYSKSELESGQLDDRYYTQGELNAGQLDGRYYTESELTDGALDGRYYTESELGSTVDGSSGASKIGISGVTGLAAGSVQGALAELQGDIDDIMDGDIDITHSLDDAYDDGSAVAVDTTDVAFTLSAARTVKIVDGTDTSKFVVTSGSGIDSVKIDTTGGVDIDTDAGFSVSDDSGSAMTFDATGWINIHPAAGNQVVMADSSGLNAVVVGDKIEILARTTSANGNDSIDMISQYGGVNVDAKKNIDFNTETVLNFKDANLTASVPLSQSGVAALSTNLTATSIIGAINENADDLDTLIDVTLPAVADGDSGADKIGVTGITGVIPTGGTIGSDGTVQSMLEGVAMGAGGGKTFASISAFTTAKAGGTYFKTSEPVFILDTNRWVIVEAQGTGVVENTDWSYVAGTNRVVGGAYEFNTTTFEVTSTGDVDIGGDTLDLTASGASVGLNTDGKVTASSAAGQLVQISSDTEVELNGGALVDINGTSVTIDGALSATGAANDMMTVTSSGLGETRLVSEKEIDLTGGDIDINAGAGKVVTIDSDTKVTATSAVEIELNGGTVDINAGAGLPITLDSDTLVSLSGGVEVDLTATTIDINGIVDMDGASASFTTSAGFEVVATGDVDISGDTLDLTASGASVGLNTDGKVTVASAAGQLVQVTSDTELELNGGALVDINGTAVTIDGIITATNTVGEHLTLTTTGLGEVVLNSEKEVNINSPYTSIAGDVTMPTDSWLSVGNIKVTSVDPNDEATISGSRSGTVNALNKLLNSGFELGTGNDASNWTEGAGVTRTNINRYYGSYSMRYQATDLATDTAILTQAFTGLTPATDHIVSAWVFGSVSTAVKVSLGGANFTLIPVGTYATWTRHSVVVTDPIAAGNLVITALGSGSEDYNFYIDAVMLDAGATLHDYFTDYKSELVFTIGDENDDRIIFRSAGSATSDLVRINQSTVEILGNLLVSGTTTTVNSQDLLVADNQIVLNSNVTGAPSLDAFFKVERGTSADTAIRWNETTDKWELTTDGTNYSAIVTASGTSGLSMDSAYDGGSSVTVDDTNVNFALAATKSFLVSDATDTNKFAVTAGSGVDSVKIDTTGGVDIDVDDLFRVESDTGTYFEIKDNGQAYLETPTGVNMVLIGGNGIALTSVTSNLALTNINYTGNDAISLTATAGGIDINTAATKPITIDSGSFSIDGVLDSNVSVTGNDLTLSTITSGDLLLTSADAITATADSVGVTANVDGMVTLTTSGTGETRLVSAQEIDLTGGAIDINAGAGSSVTIDSGTSVVINGGLLTQLDGTVIDVNGQMDFDGSLFDVNVTGTGNSALKMVSAGGVDIDTAAGVTIDDDSGAHFAMTSDGKIDLDSATGQVVEMTSDTAITLSGGVEVDLTATTIDVNGILDVDGASATIDTTGAFSLDGALASNVSTTEANLTLSTITSGNLNLTSAGELVFSDSRLSGVEFTDATYFALPGTATSIVGALNAAWDAAQGANTLDEVYDGEIGTRVITMDNGSIGFKVTDTYAFAIQDSAAANILSAQALSTGDKVEIDAILDMAGPTADFVLTGTGASSFKVDTTGGVDIDTDEGFTLNDDSGASVVVSSVGSVTLTAAAGQIVELATTGVGNVVVTSGAKVTLTSGSTASDSIKLASGGGVEIVATLDSSASVTTTGVGITSLASTQEVDITGGAVDINGGSNKDITVDTAGTGKVLVTSSDRFAITGGATSEVKVTTGDLTLHATGTGSNVYLGDIRTGDIKLSDAVNFTLPSGATSIIGAIKAAYDNKGTEVARAYHEIIASTTDVSNDYVVTTIALLPTSGTFPISPSALRTLTDQVHAVVYLNGLRLSDTEWRYSYDGGSTERRITFDGSNNITLVPGDIVMIDVEQLVSVTA